MSRIVGLLHHDNHGVFIFDDGAKVHWGGDSTVYVLVTPTGEKLVADLALPAPYDDPKWAAYQEAQMEADRDGVPIDTGEREMTPDEMAEHLAILAVGGV